MMYNIDMLEKKTTSNSSSFYHDKNQYHTVKLYTPFIDEIFNLIPIEMQNMFLTTILELFISRYASPEKNQFEKIRRECRISNVLFDEKISSEDYQKLCEEVEEDNIFILLSSLIDYDLLSNQLIPSEDVIQIQENFYYSCIEAMFDLLNKSLQPFDNVIYQTSLEYLINLFEERGCIHVQYFSYNPDTYEFYMFIPI